jgi:hypothetical protein
MRISQIVRIFFAVAFGLCIAGPASAQTIGVLQSAETMNQGTYKLMAAPIMVFGKNGTENEVGVGLRGGYAFTKYFDVEAKLGFLNNGTLVGVDGEYWIIRGAEQSSSIDFSLTGGLHWLAGKDNGFDMMGFEITPQLSSLVGDKLELCGALDASFEKLKDVPSGVDDSFTRLHLVPGIEYRISEAIDFVAEFGVAMNDNSFHYAGAGITYYIR